MTVAERNHEITRRSLLKALGGGILVLVFAPDIIAQESGRRQGAAQVPQEISAWLHIGIDGKITVLTGKVEVGQNARTSLTMAVAEELRAPVEQVTVTMGDTDLVPFDMGTFGSRTTPTMVPQVRKAAAAARETLLGLAAKQWNVDRSQLKAEAGNITNASKSVSYGDLAKGQPLNQKIDNNQALRDSAEWTVLGKSVSKVGAIDFVTGKHEYASDLKRPGMLHAKVLRPPSFGAKLKSLDTSAAEALPGVRVVHDKEFVAVAAPTVRLAESALAAIKAEWEETKQPSSQELFTLLRGDNKPPEAKAPPTGGKGLKATYTCEFIAHVPLEPRAALAEWDGSKMTVYTGTQRPFGVKPELVEALKLSDDKVRVLVPDTGSAYGGKHTGEAAVEAARIAKAIGKPIKLVWTRQEEFTWAYFRPAGIVDAASTVNAEGILQSWEFHNTNSGNPGIATPYDVAQPSIHFHEAPTPLRQGSYRALASTFNHFARESFMDELAHGSALDPVAFRIKNLKNDRLIAVLKAAADHFGWARRDQPNGHGFGIACGTEKGGYVATAAEVAVDDAKQITVLRAVIAFECGAIINPDHLKNQVEGALIMGLGGALFEKIEFDNGRILSDHLSRYRVPRYRDVPKIEYILIDRKDLPSSGAGEAPIICIAPAIANAVFNATGTRLRSMPLTLV